MIIFTVEIYHNPILTPEHLKIWSQRLTPTYGGDLDAQGYGYCHLKIENWPYVDELQDTLLPLAKVMIVVDNDPDMAAWSEYEYLDRGDLTDAEVDIVRHLIPRYHYNQTFLNEGIDAIVKARSRLERLHGKRISEKNIQSKAIEKASRDSRPLGQFVLWGEAYGLYEGCHTATLTYDLLFGPSELLRVISHDIVAGRKLSTYAHRISNLAAREFDRQIGFMTTGIPLCDSGDSTIPMSFPVTTCR